MSKRNIAKVLDALKRYFTDDEIKQNTDLNIEEHPEIHTPLCVYEMRRIEIERSNEPVEGIFYIKDGILFPDYYSERLFSDVFSPCREIMYHYYFYPRYMRRRFSDLVSTDEKSIPRGRIAGTINDPIVYIDGCYEKDADILKRIKELYRLPSMTVYSNANYRCPACYNRR